MEAITGSGPLVGGSGPLVGLPKTWIYGHKMNDDILWIRNELIFRFSSTRSRISHVNGFQYIQFVGIIQLHLNLSVVQATYSYVGKTLSSLHNLWKFAPY